MTAFTRAVLAATQNRVVRKLVTTTGAGRALAHRFVAGEDLDAAVEAARRLREAGMAVSLDLLGEEVTDREMARRAKDAYLACLDRIRTDGVADNISIKLTQLGLAFDAGLTRDLVLELANGAAEAGTTVTIDMEDSRYTEQTVEIYAECQPSTGNLGVCLQAYLRRTPDDLARIAPLRGHIRLCKGAYAEPEDVAYQEKEEVDAAFALLLEVLMRHPEVKPAIATHDERLVRLGEQLGARREGPFEFQMLYGVRTKLQRELVERGHELRIYVPYGSEWYPYLTRRLAERPANVGFFLKALLGR